MSQEPSQKQHFNVGHFHDKMTNGYGVSKKVLDKDSVGIKTLNPLTSLRGYFYAVKNLSTVFKRRNRLTSVERLRLKQAVYNRLHTESEGNTAYCPMKLQASTIQITHLLRLTM